MFSPICHLEDLLENRDRPSTYFTRGPMAIFDSIFGSEDRRRKVVRYSGSNSEEGGFRSSGSKIEDRNGGFFDLPALKIEDPLILSLRSSEPKIEDPPSSIFDLRPRRSKTSPSSIFGPSYGQKTRGATSSKIGGVL